MLKSLRILCLLAFSMFFLQACSAPSNVNLQYNKVQSSFLPAPNAPTVSVVLFNDNRQTPEVLGLRNDGTPYIAETSVNEWISRAVADELSIMGPQVSFSPTMQQAMSANPDYIVVGDVLSVEVKDTNIATHSATIRFQFRVMQGQNVIYSESLSSTQESTALPTSNSVQTLLNDTLKDIATIAASKINEKTK